MERAKGKHLVLILARELAANIATPMLIIDPDPSNLVYFNEPGGGAARRDLREHGGDVRAQVGPPPQARVARWGALRNRGVGAHRDAARQHRPLAGHVPIHGGRRSAARGDGPAMYPLLASSNEYAGSVALFWEREAE